MRVAGILVKKFKVPAANQELILAVFEGQAWPARIDNPLPPLPDLERKRRLVEAISRLNRNQKRQLLRFTVMAAAQAFLGSCCPRLPTKCRECQESAKRVPVACVSNPKHIAYLLPAKIRLGYLKRKLYQKFSVTEECQEKAVSFDLVSEFGATWLFLTE